MANVFNAAEIIDMGIEKEARRRDFYGRAAGHFTDKDFKDLFLKLRDWEETHIHKFTQIRASVADEEITESYQGEFTAYMRSLVDDMLYNQVSSDAFAKNVKTPIDAIQYGLGFEKDSILFFRELLDFMPSHNKEKISELIDEEKQHIVYLTELKYKYIKRPGGNE